MLLKKRLQPSLNLSPSLYASRSLSLSPSLYTNRSLNLSPSLHMNRSPNLCMIPARNLKALNMHTTAAPTPSLCTTPTP